MKHERYLICSKDWDGRISSTGNIRDTGTKGWAFTICGPASLVSRLMLPEKPDKRGK